jgi:uncharacterized phage-associated protein
MMQYTALDIARWIGANIDRDAGDSITHLKRQKLVYYAQAWALVLFGRPLFAEDLQAWAHGPVAGSVFHELKSHGWDALPCPEDVPTLDTDAEELLESFLDVYGDLSAKHLEKMTHSEDPWRDARGALPPEARTNKIIPKDHMRAYYSRLYEEAGNGEEQKSTSKGRAAAE